MKRHRRCWGWRRGLSCWRSGHHCASMMWSTWSWAHSGGMMGNYQQLCWGRSLPGLGRGWDIYPCSWAGIAGRRDLAGWRLGTTWSGGCPHREEITWSWLVYAQGQWERAWSLAMPKWWQWAQSSWAGSVAWMESGLSPMDGSGFGLSTLRGRLCRRG